MLWHHHNTGEIVVLGRVFLLGEKKDGRGKRKGKEEEKGEKRKGGRMEGAEEVKKGRRKKGKTRKILNHKLCSTIYIYTCTVTSKKTHPLSPS